MKQKNTSLAFEIRDYEYNLIFLLQAPRRARGRGGTKFPNFFGVVKKVT